MEQTIDKIVEWLISQVNHANMTGLVVGVSGGLDSAVVAYLIKRAFPNDSLAVTMPLHSHPDDMQLAYDVISKSGIKGMTIDLTDTHQMMYSHIKNEITLLGDLDKEKDRLADANLRARLRMSTLYTVAANYNYLVVGTDNASEWYTGYFTKYGDGGVDILPIVDFTKSEVQEIGLYLGVPEAIVYRQPSADLWEGQTDESEMGTTYDKIDAYLKGEPIPNKDKILIENMHKQTEHKRKQAKQLKINHLLP